MLTFLFRAPCFALGLACLSFVPFTPCIWDSDTISDELRGIPDALDLISGRFYRHSEAYYQERIDRLPSHLVEHPDDLGAYDDLAVAWERIGDRQKAIAVMKQKLVALDRLAKDGHDEASVKEHRYRYHANIGTFYAHSGHFDQALKEIGRAIEINPAAHFGRERFQLDLIRYIAAARKNPALWTEHDFFSHAGYALKDKYLRSLSGRIGFTARPATREDAAKNGKLVTWNDAYTAAAGMLRYGGLEGAELYRSLGDLFVGRQDLHLGWCCYQVAIDKRHPASKHLKLCCDRIREHQKQAIAHFKRPFPLPSVEGYRFLRAKSKLWLAAFQDHERKAMQAGRDPGDPKVLKELLKKATSDVPQLIRPQAKGKKGDSVRGSKVPEQKPRPKTGSKQKSR